MNICIICIKQIAYSVKFFESETKVKTLGKTDAQYH